MSKFQSYSNTIFCFLILLPVLVSSTCTCAQKQDEGRNQSKQLITYKLIAIVSVLVSGALGVCLPFLVKVNIPFLHPDNDFYLLIKAFAAGVILATGFVHVLPDAQESLTSPCLSQKPWGKFPFTGIVAMISAIGTLMMEALATGYNKRSALSKPKPIDGDEETNEVHGSSALVLESSNSSEGFRFPTSYHISGFGVGNCCPFCDYWSIPWCVSKSTHDQAIGGSIELPSIF